MESVKEQIDTYIIDTTVLKIEKKRVIVRGWKNEHGEDELEYKNIGWYMQFAGSSESIWVGSDKPYWNVGDQVEIRITRKK